jgi:hypothetical protein
MEAIATCRGCEQPVDPNDVGRVRKVEGRVILMYQHSCGQVGKVIKTKKAYKRWLARWQNYKMQGKTEVTKTYDPEEVGILVAGFRKIDLASIDSVDDLIKEWRATTPPMEKTVRPGR